MPSLRAWLISHVILPLRGTKRRFASEVRFARHFTDKIPKAAPPPARLRKRFAVLEKDDRGCKIFSVCARHATPRHTIVYLHGGAYVNEIVPAHWRIIGRIAELTEAKVIVPIYPLAPRHTWREAFTLLEPLVQDLAARSAPGTLTVMGDSAGGGLALALIQQLRHTGARLPDRLVLLSPWLDTSMTDPAVLTSTSTDRMLDVPGLRWAGMQWARGLEVTNPVVSPLFGSLSGLPPTAVFTGTADILNADARRLREKAVVEGLKLVYFEYPGLFHVWMGAPIPEGERALRQAAQFILQTHDEIQQTAQSRR